LFYQIIFRKKFVLSDFLTMFANDFSNVRD